MNIPIYIICHNNGWMVRKTMEDLYYKFFDADFVVVDQASSAQRTMDILHEIGAWDRVQVRRLWFNVGPKRVGRFLHQYAMLRKSPYVLTDPDLDLGSLPGDALEVLRRLSGLLDTHAVGLALGIDDPEDFLNGPYAGEFTILEWETRHWRNPVEAGGFEAYRARIDTTFCYYDWTRTRGSAIRVAGAYTVKHLPWHKSYIDRLDARDYHDYFAPSSRDSTSSNLVRLYWQSQNHPAERPGDAPEPGPFDFPGVAH